MTEIGIEAEAKGKPGKGLRIALALSVTLNLAILGLVAGAILRDGPGMRAAMVRDLGFGPYTEALRPEDRKAMRQALFQRAPEIRETRRMMRDEAEALLVVLRADPLDADALRARMEAQHSRLSDQMRVGQDVLQEFILAMPTAERLAFADRLEGGLRHHGKDKDGKKGD